MSVQQNIYRQRVQFSKIRSLVPIPNLIDIQKRSYDEFLRMNLLHEEREARGLKTVFDSMFPVHNGKTPDGSDASLEVEFVDYTVGHWACKCGKNEAWAISAPPARTATITSWPIIPRIHGGLPQVRRPQQERGHHL